MSSKETVLVRERLGSLEDQLCSAVKKNEIPAVACLLAQGANANITCTTGRTALGIASEIGNVTVVKMLLDSCVASYSPVQEPLHHRKQKGKKSRRDYSYSMMKTKKDANSVTGDIRQSSPVEFPDEKFPNDKRFEKCNQGYYIVVHKEEKPVAACKDHGQNSFDENWNSEEKDIHTPDGMERLEWDTEMDSSTQVNDVENDSWGTLYQWYADIFDRTGSLLASPPQFDVNHQDVYGRCAVHYAAHHGNDVVLELLTSTGCHLDIGDSDNLTPLHLAASQNHHQIVDMLLRSGVEVNRKTSDKTCALHIAASRGYFDTVGALIKYGANIDSLDASDRTPLHLAVSRGHDVVVQLLIQNGAKVNIEEIHGYTPLCEAVWEKKLSLVKLLLDAGAKAKVTQSHHLLHYAVAHRQFEMVDLLLQAGCIVNLRDDNGDTPLILACRTDCCNIIELLLKTGAFVNYPNALTGNTPLHEAVEFVRKHQYSLFERIFALLRSYGASLNIHATSGGDTPVYRAVLLQKYEIAALLIRHGSNLNNSNIGACKLDILNLAKHRRNFPIVRMIVYAGFDLRNSTPDIIPVSNPSAICLETIEGWLTHMKYNAWSLADLTRIVIREKLGENVYSAIRNSGLPNKVKNFVLLEDN